MVSIYSSGGRVQLQRLIDALDDRDDRLVKQFQIYVNENDRRDLKRWVPQNVRKLPDRLSNPTERPPYNSWLDQKASDAVITDPRQLEERLSQGGLGDGKEAQVTYMKNTIAFSAFMVGRMDDNDIINTLSAVHWMFGRPNTWKITQGKSGIDDMMRYGIDVAEAILM